MIARPTTVESLGALAGDWDWVGQVVGGVANVGSSVVNLINAGENRGAAIDALEAQIAAEEANDARDTAAAMAILGKQAEVKNQTTVTSAGAISKTITTVALVGGGVTIVGLLLYFYLKK